MTASARLDGIWRRQCVQCDGAAPSCNCDEGEKCVLTGRTCQQCPTIQCIPSGSGSNGKSINPGVIAGPVVAVLLIASLGALWWLRRKRRRALERLEELAQRARKAESKSFQLSQPGSPNPGSAHSGRSGSQRGGSTPAHDHDHDRSALNAADLRSGHRSPLPPAPVNAEYYDENGANVRVYTGNIGTIDLRRDPFSDRQSISTEGSGQQSMHIIPIQYIPPSGSDDAIATTAAAGSGSGSGPGFGLGSGKRPVSHAARTLDEARKNLFRPGQAPPRPARSPDLDLRLNPPIGDLSASTLTLTSTTNNNMHMKSPTFSTDYRDSYLSGHSGAPSFMSGSTDIHLDAPKIVTSRQVHVGRVQQAEVVQMGMGYGKAASPGDVRSNPFDTHDQASTSSSNSHSTTTPRSPPSPATFGHRSFGVGPGSEDAHGRAGGVSGTGGYRTLTPSSRRHNHDGEGDDGDGDGDDLENESFLSGPGGGDLRFSMGSLAYRDSVSTMGTGRYLAQAQVHSIHGNSGLGQGDGMALPPRIGLGFSSSSGSAGGGGGARESISSARSGTDSLLGLGGFPIIPPSQNQLPPSNSGLPSLPQSTSVSTLDHAALISRPPPSYRPPPPVSSSSSTRRVTNNGNGGNANVNNNNNNSARNTAHSMADSFLGTFPFIPPSQGDLDTLPGGRQNPRPSVGIGMGNVASDNDNAIDNGVPLVSPRPLGAGGVGRNTQGMSTTSEALGLGGFDFNFGSGREGQYQGDGEGTHG